MCGCPWGRPKNWSSGVIPWCASLERVLSPSTMADRRARSRHEDNRSGGGCLSCCSDQGCLGNFGAHFGLF
jgi:hypothetical protein